MRIRLGFVSNSSSSSFVLIVSKDNYDKVYESLSPLEKDMATWLKELGQVGPLNIVEFSGYNGEDGWTFERYKPGKGKTGYIKGTDEDGEENLDVVWNEIEEKLKKAGPHCYSYQSN